MAGEQKYAVFIFQDRDDFEVCNKYMGAEQGSICIYASKTDKFSAGERLDEGLSGGRICVRVDTGSILVPPGILIAKTSNGRDIPIEVISGTSRKIADVDDGRIYPIG